MNRCFYRTDKFKKDSPVVNRQTINEAVRKKLINLKRELAKPIIQINLDGSILTIWDSLSQIERVTGRHMVHVRNCCLGRRHTAYGFVWKYKN